MLLFGKPGSAMIIGAHPDDAVLGVGGTASLLKQAGWRVIVLTASDGGRGGHELTRRAEEESATSMLSFDLHYGSMQDGALELRSCIEFIEKWYSFYSPSVVFTHAPCDTHQDHTTLTSAAVIATRKCPCVLYYEGPSTQGLEPSLRIDVSKAWSAKLAALRTYHSQLTRLDLVRWAESTAAFRCWPNPAHQMMEAFQPYRIMAELDPLQNFVDSGKVSSFSALHEEV